MTTKHSHTLTKLILGALAAFYVGAHAQSSRTAVYAAPGINNIDKTAQIGAGLQVGSLSGATLDYWYNSRRSWNASVLADYGNTALAIAHQWMFPNSFSGSANILVPYIGVGALIAFGSQDDYFASRTESQALAVQMPLGMELLPALQRFGIFAELKPSLEVSPVTYGFLNADLGARFYF